MHPLLFFSSPFYYEKNRISAWSLQHEDAPLSTLSQLKPHRLAFLGHRPTHMFSLYFVLVFFILSLTFFSLPFQQEGGEQLLKVLTLVAFFGENKRGECYQFQLHLFGLLVYICTYKYKFKRKRERETVESEV